MPIYKYECKECGHTFEDLRSFSEPDPEACPKCDADAVQKLITGGNFVLKGSGWYVTDYASSTGGDSGGTSAEKGASQPDSDAQEGAAESTAESSSDTSTSAPADTSSTSGAKPDGSKVA